MSSHICSISFFIHCKGINLLLMWKGREETVRKVTEVQNMKMYHGVTDP